jgi:hypothetical protein
VPPVVVAWDGRMSLPFSVPAEMDLDWECEVTLEGGGSVRAHGRLFDLPATDHAWPAGVVHCVWDAYEPSPGVLNYEVWHARLGADGRWSAPENRPVARARTSSLRSRPRRRAGCGWPGHQRGGRRPVVQ